MNNIQTNRKIDNHFELRKTLWTAFIVLTGGIAALLLNLDSNIKLFLLIIGILADIVLISSITYQNNQIEKLLNQLQEN